MYLKGRACRVVVARIEWRERSGKKERERKRGGRRKNGEETTNSLERYIPSKGK